VSVRVARPPHGPRPGRERSLPARTDEAATPQDTGLETSTARAVAGHSRSA
jgi:hypothetical protein